MKKKIIIVLVVLLAGGGFVAKSMFLKPAVAKEKIEGTIYILPKQFTANLKDGRYATLEELLRKNDKMGDTKSLSTDDRAALEAYLRTL